MGRRIAGVAALLALLGAVAAATALAHTKPTSVTPRGTVGKGTGGASVTFTQAVRRGSLRVTGPGGRTYSRGSGGRDPRNVKRVGVGLGGLRSGGYRASWTIKASDGHTQRGSWTFRVR